MSGTTMRAAVLTKVIRHYSAEDVQSAVEIQDVPIPEPKSGEVLIKVAYSAINPSDLSYFNGTYGKSLELPSLMGFEGSGVVVKNGGGLMGWRINGKKVAFAPTVAGSWAEYVVVPATSCVDLPDTLDLKDAASALVNPLTVLAFLEIAKRGGHTAIVHTTAASALGRMLIRLGKTEGVETVCVVRRPDQAEICKSAGATYVVDSSSETFEADLRAATTKLGARLAFDAIGDDSSLKVLRSMPNGSTCHVYGGLSGKASASVALRELIFRQQTLSGFWLTDYMRSQKNLAGIVLWSRRVPQLLTGDLKTEYAKVIKLDEVAEGLLWYPSHMSAGKVLIAIGQTPAEPEAAVAPAAAEAAEGAAPAAAEVAEAAVPAAAEAAAEEAAAPAAAVTAESAAAPAVEATPVAEAEAAPPTESAAAAAAAPAEGVVDESVEAAAD